MKFHTAVVIFNPNSTGDSESNAREFARRLSKSDTTLSVKIVATEYAGHAEEIASEYAGDSKTLVVSSSGDGGYNEVINGVLGSKGTCAVAVLPSGNANDHYNALASDDLVKNIARGETRTIEAIRLESHVKGKAWVRYAHSYVGFGITPKIGKELTIRKLNAFNEKWHTVYHLMQFKHVDISKGKVINRYSSLIFSTIGRMSKIIRLDESASHSDGKMEVYETLYQSPWQLIVTLLHASLKGLTKTERVKKYELKTIDRTMVQLDGEVFTLDAKAKVTLVCQRDAITTVL
jgi:diacylglycerol kinase family enzyme